MNFSIDTEPLRFGKYKGYTPEEIAEHDPSYLVWLYDTVTPRVCSKELALACEADDREDDEDRWTPGAGYEGDC